MLPEKAMVLTEFIRTVEASSGASELAPRRLSIVENLLAQGVHPYFAYAAILCHPSDSEQFMAIGSDHLAERGDL
jgi:hypothetical protein